MLPERSSRLLSLLRNHLDDPAIDYAETPRVLPGGAFTEVLTFSLTDAPDAWSRPLVLRLYPDSAAATQPVLEAAVQNGLAASDFPAPRVLFRDVEGETLGQRFIVMTRAPGRPFLRGIGAGEFARDFPALLVSWGKTVAEVQARLHAVDASAVVASFENERLDLQSVTTARHLAFVEHQIDRSNEDGLGDGLTWLRAHEPPMPARPSVVHGDLWPGNVLMQRQALTGVVDWDRAAIGDPALDVGFAKAGLSLMPAPFPPPPPIRQAVRFAGRLIARDLHRAYDKLRPISADAVAYYEALRCFLELAIVIEHRLIATGDPSSSRPPPAWQNGTDALTQQFTGITGVPVRLAAD